MAHDYIFIKDAQTLPVAVVSFSNYMEKYPAGGYCTLVNPDPKHTRKWWRRALGSWDQLDVSDVPKEILTIKLLGGY
jgi:hypothetical protein